MKLQANLSSGQHVIGAHGPGWVDVDSARYRRSVLVTPKGIDPDWGPESFEALAEAHLLPLAEHAGAVVLLGTGNRQRFPSPALLRPLIEAGIGIEVMDTAAACRTYIIVVAESRLSVAALIIE